MRTVRVQDATADMIVCKDIYNSDGKVLVAKGVKLTERYIDRLRDFNVKTIEVLDAPKPSEGDSGSGAALDPVRLTKDELELLINRSIRQLIKTDTRKKELMLQIEEVFEVVLEDAVVVEHMFRMKSIGDGSFGKAVQVAVLSVAMGIQLETDMLPLIQLGKASLLYDIGKCFLRKDLVYRTDKLDDKEIHMMYEHTIAGYMLLQSHFPENVAIVALQHHERFNGSGYPRQIGNDRIHPFARIVSVADVYVALKSHRPDRPAYQPYEALEYVLGAGDHLFDSRVVNAFNEVVVTYALGSVVQINDGRVGVVSGIRRNYSQRPEVTLLFDEQNMPMSQQTVDLSAHPTLFISRVLHE